MPDKMKQPRRAKLTLAQKLEPLNRVIASLEERVRKARERRVRLIEDEEKRIIAATREMSEARALEQTKLSLAPTGTKH